MQDKTPGQDLANDRPDPALDKLGSAQPDNDLADGGATGIGTIPTELIAADVRPIEMRPVEGIPAETQAVDFMTPEGRPRELRPT